MQNAEIISINILQILISITNLLILYLFLDKFFYKQIKNILSARESSIAEVYKSAYQAKEEADNDRIYYRKKLENAEDESRNIIESTLKTAYANEEKIIKAAKAKADSMIKDAEDSIISEYKRSEENIKNEITDVGVMLAQRLLEREISVDDHKIMIEHFFSELDKEVS